jgi:hypothetical protein
MAIELLVRPRRGAFLGEPIDQDITLILLQFDATINENHISTAEITEHPVEEGADTADHIRSLPDEIEINGMVTNDPILFLKSLRAQPSVSGGDPRTRAEDAWEELKRIKREGQIVTVFTWLEEYTDMAITSLTTPRDKDLGNALDVTVTLRKIVKATTETVEPPEPATPSRAPKKKRGKQTTKPAGNAAAGKGQSITAGWIGNP